MQREDALGIPFQTLRLAVYVPLVFFRKFMPTHLPLLGWYPRAERPWLFFNPNLFRMSNFLCVSLRFSWVCR